MNRTAHHPRPFILSLSKHFPSFSKLSKRKNGPLTSSGRTIAVLVLGPLSTPALAHSGHDAMSGFAAGLLHPITGLDHLAAMLMIGLWAGTRFHAKLIIPPLTFVTLLLAGFAYGTAGGALPLTELLILASVMLLGGMLLFEVKPPLVIASTMIALFAFAHGHAHGAEMPAQASPVIFASGFALMTALLHGAGIGLALAASRPAIRGVGGGVAAMGVIWILAP